MKALPHEWKILVPWDRNEALSVSEAAFEAHVTPGTIRNWCQDFGVGRKQVGTWKISKVALAMHLDGNTKALEAYLSGDRCGDLVAPYFKRATAQKTQSHQS